MEPANILVVDDDAVARDLLAEALREKAMPLKPSPVEKRSSLADARDEWIWC